MINQTDARIGSETMSIALRVVLPHLYRSQRHDRHSQFPCRKEHHAADPGWHLGRVDVSFLCQLLDIELAAGPMAVAPGAMVHEVGTARMGGDRASSFCNAWSQSWEVDNLFVPDGACWTTSAYQNPTLTMMALAHRCATHVSRFLGVGQVG